MEEVVACGVCGATFKEEHDFINHCESAEHYEGNSNLVTRNTDAARNVTSLLSTNDSDKVDGQQKQAPVFIDPLSIPAVNNDSNGVVDITSNVIKAEQPPETLQLGNEPGLNERDKLRKYMCSYCSKKCMTGTELSNHERTHTKDRPFQCNLCNKAYSFPASLYKHRKAKHKNAMSNQPVVVNGKTRDNKIFKHMCSFCGKGFQTTNSLQLHERIHTGARPVQCSECQATFTTRGSCFMHMRRIHNKEPVTRKNRVAKVDSIITGSRFDLECFDDYEEVDSVPEKTVAFNPRDGSENVSSTSNTKSYVNAPRVYQCPYCPKTWKRNPDLVKHVRIHTGEKPFTCPVCSKAFSTGFHRNRHIKVHHDWEMFKDVFGVSKKRIHECLYCPKTFRGNNDLVKHIRRHIGEKPFKCPSCPKAFIRRYDRDKHVRSAHKEEYVNSTVAQISKYKCPYCPRAWNSRACLELHLRYHKADKPYQCLVCQKTFHVQDALYGHMRNMHDWESHKGLYEQVVREVAAKRSVPILGSGDSTETMRTKYVTRNMNNSGESRSVDNDAIRIHNMEDENESDDNDVVSRNEETEEAFGDSLTVEDVSGSGVVSEYRCSFCDISPFETYSSRDTHERLHDACTDSDLTLSQSLAGNNHCNSLGVRRFKCSFCEKMWPTRSSRREHERIHTGDRPVQCSQCKKRFRNRGSVLKHIRRTHKKEPVLNNKRVLKVSKAVFSSDLESNGDSALNNINQDNMSDEVDVATSNDSEMNDRNEKTISETTDGYNVQVILECDDQVAIEFHYKCTFCSIERFKTHQERDQHEETHDDFKPSNSNVSLEDASRSGLFQTRKLKCSFCDKMWNRRSARRRHERIHTDGKSLQCSLCKKRFRTKAVVFRHMRMVHKKEPALQKPATRGVVHLTRNTHDAGEGSDRTAGGEGNTSNNTHAVSGTTASSDGSHHVAKVDSMTGSRVGLDSCDDNEEVDNVPEKTIAFNPRDGSENVSSTSNTKSYVNAPRVYQCPYCPKTWKRNPDLVKHVRLHTGEKPFTCPVCSKAFSTGFHRNRHIKVHHDWEMFKDVFGVSKKRIHECLYCPKTFRRNSDLVKHVRRHIGEKPFKCPSCPKAFVRRYDRDKHVRSAHKEEYVNSTVAQISKYKCPYCPRAWNSRACLELHLRCHSADKPYQCPVCQKTFHVQDELYGHIRNVHDWETHKGLYEQVVREVAANRRVPILESGDSTETMRTKYVESNMNNSGESRSIDNDAIRIHNMEDENESDDNDVVGMNEETEEAFGDSLTVEDVSGSGVVSEYRCSFCDISPFETYSSRDTHERLHDACTDSDLTLSQSLAGNNHCNSLGVRRFKCSFCEKMWSTRSSRREHERIHTGDRPVQCSQCKKRFRNRGSVLKHIRRTHKKEPVLKNRRVLKVSKAVFSSDLESNGDRNNTHAVSGTTASSDGRNVDSTGRHAQDENLMQRGDTPVENGQDVIPVENKGKGPVANGRYTLRRSQTKEKLKKSDVEARRVEYLATFRENDLDNILLNPYVALSRIDAARPQTGDFVVKVEGEARFSSLQHNVVNDIEAVLPQQDVNGDGGMIRKQNVLSVNCDSDVLPQDVVRVKGELNLLPQQDLNNEGSVLVLEKQQLLNMNDVGSRVLSQQNLNDNENVLPHNETDDCDEGSESVDVKESTPPTHVLNEPIVSLVKCVHGSENDGTHSCTFTESNSCWPVAQKVVKISYNNGRVRLFRFSLTPFDCSGCVSSEAVTPTHSGSQKVKGNKEETLVEPVIIDNHRTYTNTKRCANFDSQIDGSGLNTNANTDEGVFDGDPSRVMDVIAQSQDFKTEITQLMAMDDSPTHE